MAQLWNAINGSEMQLKTGRFGKYFGCLNDNCGATRALKMVSLNL